jgi:hypothetical protein
MSAFLGYEGVYEHHDETFIWRCYATAPVYDVRRADHAPLPDATPHRHWVHAAHRRFEKPVAFLVDGGVSDFSQMLVQVVAQPKASRSERRRHPEANEGHLGAA